VVFLARRDETRRDGMKRKADAVDGPAAATANGRSKKAATEANAIRDRFGPAIFEPETVKSYADGYVVSGPYKHAVVCGLVEDGLLRSVRREILDNIHFTPKETDIYKIHQSGDLANLDGLDPAALEKLPSLLKLRDALYSKDFREWISTVSGAGPVSGKKTDMAVNLYVPGCHLLCHDDVIGSRRVSYILYLTDPDKPWKAEWGGALRLYPTDEKKGEDGKTYKVPRPEWSKVIPPAWNQLSFFEVQPGESFHDVEEVYHRGEDGSEEEDGGRYRMAISGWFHIPQEGEDGYEEGLEERLAEKSSLQQLQGKAEQFDEPQIQWMEPVGQAEKSDGDSEELTEKDLDFLLQYMTPHYLTPETVEELNEIFADESILQLTNFLSPKFSAKLKESLESSSQPTIRAFATSRPPHKHRYQYLLPQANTAADSSQSPLELILDDLLPSMSFRKWLALVSGLSLGKCAVLARRFRRSLDYQLAQSYEGEDPRLEYTLSITPSSGWGADEADKDADGGADGGAENGAEAQVKGKGRGKGKAAEKPAQSKKQADEEDEDNVGGYELYMAGDDIDDDDDADDGSDDGVNIPASAGQPSHTGAGDRRSTKKSKKTSDPAIYQSAAEGEDDGILFSNPAAWNTLSLVLRDQGTLRFVKYVSAGAKGDRWDFEGRMEVLEEDGEDGEE
jgi:prolyl 3-hydroxylase /prolyl 3,4-dihydroxylase